MEEIKIGNLQLFHLSDFLELLVRFTFNIAMVLLLVRWLYYTATRRKDYLFTYVIISSVIFLLSYMLESVKIQLGFALGLFAVFGIIRYRTLALPIREMTYLFMVIGVSMINALSNKKTSIAEMLFTNLIIIFITYGFERIWLLKHEKTKTIVYDKIELIIPEKRAELLEDLKLRTGISDINHIELGKINFLKDTCRITIHYIENEKGIADLKETNESDDDSDD